MNTSMEHIGDFAVYLFFAVRLIRIGTQIHSFGGEALPFSLERMWYQRGLLLTMIYFQTC